MKARLVLVIILALSVAAVILVQRRHVAARLSPQPALHLLGDSERDLTTVPFAMTRLTDAQEMRIGRGLAGEVLPPSSKPLNTRQQAWQALIVHIGGRLAQHAHRKLDWQFHLLPDPDLINAFALPGGQIFVGQGLIQILQTRDELAMVLGHEIEHVDHYHCAERVQMEAQARRLHVEVAADVLQLPLGVLEAGYSKQQEAQADREGMRLAVQSAYSPAGALRLFRQLQALDPVHRRQPGSPAAELSKMAEATLEDYFRSHPPTAEREQQLAGLIASEHWNAHAPERPMPPQSTPALKAGRLHVAAARDPHQ